MRNDFRTPRMGRMAAWLLAGALALGAAGCEDGTEPSDPAGQGSAPASTPSSAPPSTYRLASGGKVLVDSDGTRIQVSPKALTGYVDNAQENGQFVDMSGWAAPANLSGPAEIVVAIAGKKSVAAVAPSGDRPDLVEGYDRPGLAKAGFAISVPKSSLDCSAPDQGLQTFGVAGDAASPLKWLADVPERLADAC